MLLHYIYLQTFPQVRFAGVLLAVLPEQAQ